MKRLLLRAYPAAWRRRYGDELELLLDDTGTAPGVIFDVLRAALRARVDAVTRAIKGGEVMRIEPLARHPFGFAMASLVLMAPTLVLVVASILGHELGISAIASVVDPLIVWVTAPRIVDLALVAAPAISLVLAMLPILEVDVRSGDGGATPVATLSLRLRAMNLVMGVLALLLGAALVAHIVVESVLQAGP